ncbi:thioredoxin family protein [Elizabethkingia sp. JS20170427COW]|uniref:thioredoxin family protein n=1 Tax=Elizabethkingia sp. JS20170427COW TaxID=2583851 RepID=UPI00111076D1|nr:thioredoxin family protein [Elizabethkingia sp. JS20170427COW]QCX53458.1 thioredoxin family protein [Elizabethkingia sp. JS20170427COW]
MEIKKFWDEGVSYEQYLINAQQSLDNPKNEEEKEKAEYYQLGLQRMKRMTERYTPDAEQLEQLKQKNFKGKVLIIAEAWCGDASQAIPVLAEFFKEQGVRITYRDQEPSLIDDFLTNGAKSIPVVILLDENFKVINTWGARPRYGKELLAKFKADPEVYPREQFYNDLQKYYAKNKGYDTIEEILALL